MKLSILICTIPERRAMFEALLSNLKEQIDTSRDIEIVFDATEKITVGEKRNKLLREANGEYVTFIDDDDRISHDYVKTIYKAIDEFNVDCFCFNAYYSHNGGQFKVVDYSKFHKQDKNTEKAFLRIPNHLMCVKRHIALKVGFKNKSYGEDSDYAKRLLPYLKLEYKLNKVLYYYDYNDKTTKTRPRTSR